MSRIIPILALACLTTPIALLSQATSPTDGQLHKAEETQRNKPIDPDHQAGPHMEKMGKKSSNRAKIKGEVTAVDATTKTITVDDITATWDEKTVIAPKGKTSTDINAGDTVTLFYKTDGHTKMATKVVLHPSKKTYKKN
jgi:hypothetical protein